MYHKRLRERECISDYAFDDTLPVSEGVVEEKAIGGRELSASSLPIDRHALFHLVRKSGLAGFLYSYSQALMSVEVSPARILKRSNLHWKVLCSLNALS